MAQSDKAITDQYRVHSNAIDCLEENVNGLEGGRG